MSNKPSVDQELLRHRAAVEQSLMILTDIISGEQLSQAENLSKRRIEAQLQQLRKAYGVEHIKTLDVDQCGLRDFNGQTKCLAFPDLRGNTLTILLGQKGVVAANIAPFKNYKAPSRKDAMTGGEHATAAMPSLMKVCETASNRFWKNGDKIDGIMVAPKLGGDFLVMDAIGLALREVEPFARKWFMVTYNPFSPPTLEHTSYLMVDGREGNPKIYLNGSEIVSQSPPDQDPRKQDPPEQDLRNQLSVGHIDPFVQEYLDQMNPLDQEFFEQILRNQKSID